VTGKDKGAKVEKLVYNPSSITTFLISAGTFVDNHSDHCLTASVSKLSTDTARSTRVSVNIDSKVIELGGVLFWLARELSEEDMSGDVEHSWGASGARFMLGESSPDNRT
jgi:hypothetical protein